MAEESLNVAEKDVSPVSPSKAEVATPEQKTAEKSKQTASNKESGGEKMVDPEKVAAVANRAAEKQNKKIEARTPNEHKGFFSRMAEKWRNVKGWKKMAIGAGLMALTLGGAAAGSTAVMGAGWLGGRILSGIGMFSVIDGAAQNKFKSKLGKGAATGGAILGGVLYAAFVPKIFSTLNVHLGLTEKAAAAIDFSKQAGKAAGDVAEQAARAAGRVADEYGPIIQRHGEALWGQTKQGASIAGEHLERGIKVGGEYLSQGAEATQHFFSPREQMRDMLYPVYQMQSGEDIKTVLMEKFPDVQGLDPIVKENRVDQIIGEMKKEGMIAAGEIDFSKVHALSESPNLAIPGAASEGVSAYAERMIGSNDFDKRLGHFLFSDSTLLENLPIGTSNEKLIEILQTGNQELKRLSKGLSESLLDMIHDAKGKSGYDDLVEIVGYKKGLLGESLGAKLPTGNAGEEPLKSVLAKVMQWKLAHGA